jgi:nitrate/TMAO reductase-like tetraheme cytochrome c subunit
MSLIICLCFVLIQCINNGDTSQDQTSATDTFQQYTGSASCAKCHKQIYDSFALTGHNLTSLPAEEKSIKGSFEKGKNEFHYNHYVYVSMGKKDSGFYETEFVNGSPALSRRFDITIGSGIRGQTYLSWQNNFLTQLPVSYLTSVNDWTNSPGDLDQVIFDRPVNSTCLQCHTTYASDIPGGLKNMPEEFDHQKILYGIGCERCHGPGAEHVKYQTENPTATVAKYILNPVGFTRQQSLDMCTQCHGGRMQNIKPSFSFIPGDKLHDYFIVNKLLNKGGIDVHGNQMGLLAESKCFVSSSAMTCLTCHSPHDDNRGNLALFSERCMTCHNKEHGTFCKINPDKVSNISSNCIDCHMPKQTSKAIVMQLQNSKEPIGQLLRTHLIAIYSDKTNKFVR